MAPTYLPYGTPQPPGGSWGGQASSPHPYLEQSSPGGANVLPGNSWQGSGLPSGIAAGTPSAMPNPAQLREAIAQLPPEQQRAVLAQMASLPQGNPFLGENGEPLTTASIIGAPRDWLIAAPAGIGMAAAFNKVLRPDSWLLQGVRQLEPNLTGKNIVGLNALNRVFSQKIYSNGAEDPTVRRILTTQVDPKTLTSAYLKNSKSVFQSRLGSSPLQGVQQNIVGQIHESKDLTQLLKVATEAEDLLKAEKTVLGKLQGVFHKMSLVADPATSPYMKAELPKVALEELKATIFSAHGNKAEQEVLEATAKALGVDFSDIFRAATPEKLEKVLDRTLTSETLNRMMAGGPGFIDDALTQQTLVAGAISNVKALAGRFDPYIQNYTRKYNLIRQGQLTNNPIGRWLVGTLSETQRVVDGTTMGTGGMSGGGASSMIPKFMRPVTDAMGQMLKPILHPLLERIPDNVADVAKRHIRFAPALAGGIMIAPALYEARNEETSTQDKVALFFHRLFGGMLGSFLGWEVGKTVLTPVVHSLLGGDRMTKNGALAAKSVLGVGGKRGARKAGLYGWQFLKALKPVLSKLPLVGPWLLTWTLGGTLVELVSLFVIGGLFAKAGEKLSHKVFGTPQKIAEEEQERERQKHFRAPVATSESPFSAFNQPMSPFGNQPAQFSNTSWVPGSLTTPQQPPVGNLSMINDPYVGVGLPGARGLEPVIPQNVLPETLQQNPFPVSSDASLTSPTLTVPGLTPDLIRNSPARSNYEQLQQATAQALQGLRTGQFTPFQGNDGVQPVDSYGLG